MMSIKQVGVAIALFSLLIFVVLFGQTPACRKGPVGILSRFIRFKIPDLLIRTDAICTGGRLSKYLEILFDYLINQNHPVILMLYLVLLVGSETLFIYKSWSNLPTIHKAFALCSSLAPIFFTFKAVLSSSSTITPRNHRQKMHSYPYDHVLYHPGQICRTCNFLKPARSKHCSICNVCVAKHDHHCVWIMNCVGQNNISHFLCMLLSLSLLLTYGAYLAYTLLSKQLQQRASGHLDRGPGNKHWSTGLSWSHYAAHWIWALGQDFRIGGIGLLALLTAPLAWSMFLYHIYLVWAGTTTNESSKWSEWKEYIEEGLVYKWVGATASAFAGSKDPETEPTVDWPIYSAQRLFRSEDGRPPGTLTDAGGTSASWNRVRGLYEIENLYDLGFWDNLDDVFWPT
ncbi:MAG: hypothetical protein LQ339_000906 [Xanthoria mediterranea]|nr:MAG: hypothetical protein LQ339_000906 [Xanthoria mediterranea]